MKQNPIHKTERKLTGFVMSTGETAFGKNYKFTCPVCGMKSAASFQTRKQAKDGLSAHLRIGRKWTMVRCQGRPGGHE